jgi:global nitrogen regulator NrpRII
MTEDVYDSSSSQRIITPRCREEGVKAPGPLIFTLARIENLIHQVSFDPIKGEGKIITNTITVNPQDLSHALEILEDTIQSGLAVCPRVKIEEVKDRTVIHTACSLTIDGVLVKHGIPVRPKGGGIVEVVERQPMRFIDLLMYWATTIDPIDILISQELTDVTGMMRTGSGRVLGNLQEAPMLARERIEEVLDYLAQAEFTGILELGEPNADVLGVSVERDRLGVALVGGTNLVAAAMEEGIDIKNESISGLTDISEMKHLDEIT